MAPFATPDSQLAGVAACRGERWASLVWRRVKLPSPWPPYEGRDAEIARRWVRDLASDQRVREMLAVETCWWASRRWDQLRAMGDRLN